MNLFERLRRVRALNHLIPLEHAFKAAFHFGAPRTLHSSLRSTGKPFTVRLGTSDLRVAEQIFARQEYSLWKSIKPRTIIDAGANIGCATLFFAERYPDARIISIEPDPSNFEILTANTAALPNVTPVAGAVWSHESTLTFVNPNSGKWAVSMKERTGDGYAVLGMPLSRIMDDFGLLRVDVLKMDIEGAEKEVFSAPDLSWLDRVGTIVIELHDFLRTGCAKAFYSAISNRNFEQHQRGDLVFINFLES